MQIRFANVNAHSFGCDCFSFFLSFFCSFTCFVKWFATMNSTHELSSPPPPLSPLSAVPLLMLIFLFLSLSLLLGFPVWDNNTCQTQFSVVVCMPSSVLLMWIKSLVSRKMALTLSLMGHSGIRKHTHTKKMPCELFNMLAQVNWKSRK